MRAYRPVQLRTSLCTSALEMAPTGFDPSTGRMWLARMPRSRSIERARFRASDSSQSSETVANGVLARRESIHALLSRLVRSVTSNACASRLVKNVREYSLPPGSRSRTS
jgi:hypothetical protein